MTSVPNPDAQTASDIQPTTPLPEFAEATPDASSGAFATSAPAPEAYVADAPESAPATPTTLAHMNAFALIAIVLAFVQPIAGIIFGHIGLSQIKRNGDAGRGVALTATIISYVMVAGIVLAILAYLTVLAVAFATMGLALDGIDSRDFSDFS